MSLPNEDPNNSSTKDDDNARPNISSSMRLSTSSSVRMLSPTRPHWPRRLSEVPRKDHMDELIAARRQSMKCIFPKDDKEDKTKDDDDDVEAKLQKLSVEQNSEFVRQIQAMVSAATTTDGYLNSRRTPMEIRLCNVNYQVQLEESDHPKISTIYNSSPLYKIQKLIQSALLSSGRKKKKDEVEWTNVLSNVNLVLQPKKMYLVLGPPLSGKTSLLKAIAGMLSPSSKKKKDGSRLSGSIRYNNLNVLGGDGEKHNKALLQNLVAFVRQSDDHAPRLTVDETFRFATNCKDPSHKPPPSAAASGKGSGKISGRVESTLEALGLTYVKDTFVGDENVRGVSGGQRRRVTLGEMLVFDTSLLCGDEISSGLDTASTVDILSILSYITRLFHRVTVVSLLQPSPEAVALFDEIILLGEGGTILFNGPTEDARDYFVKLGYAQPDGMDDADYLLAVASSDRHLLYRPNGLSDVMEEVDSTQMLGEKFTGSAHGQEIKATQDAKWDINWSNSDKKSVGAFAKKYQNSFIRSVWLNFKRAFTLWTRDNIFIRASVIKNIAMGVTVGAVFFDTDLNSSYFGVLFQGNLFIMLGAMASAPEKINDRTIFYKHDDSNFYPAASYVIGQSLALIPQMVIDVLLFGTLVYFMVGFAAGGFVLYLVLFISFNYCMGSFFGLLAAVGPNKAVVGAGGALLLLLNTLFCGFIVSPTVIPPYYIWIYWMMPLSWVYRALLLNEYTSEKFSDGSGDEILESYGFMHLGEPFSREWIGYCFAYIVPFTFLCMLLSAVCLHYYRVEPRKSKPDTPESFEIDREDKKAAALADSSTFVPVTLTFSNLSYTVKSSVGGEDINLLTDVSGIFYPGRMLALMGESGAGKTTLMDVIALRKQSGKQSGDILLNGFPQMPISFRRCSGYVEQFDVQSAELTVRETITFSAVLRLDRADPAFQHPDGIKKHVSLVIDMLELNNEADLLVGNSEEGGLTFEQKKRLSIAAELAASPSIVFLDEPTSGLDARAALLVMNALRRIANTGRTIVATIHQPSSTVFDMFDDLLLLKKGGEVVFHGALGECSSSLISYFENLGASPMNKGENPATWMLNVLSEPIKVKAENGQEAPLCFAYAWAQSDEYNKLQTILTEVVENKKDEIAVETEFAAPKHQRDSLMANRLVTIYWRSPAYNLSRMMLSIFIGKCFKSLFDVAYYCIAANKPFVLALLLSSMFIPIRRNKVFSEAEMSSFLSTIFIAFIIVGVLSITSAMPVMLSIRDMFYRHKAAGMLGYSSVGRALATAEKRFIIIASVLFCIVFLPVSGILEGGEIKKIAGQSFAFWGFFTFNMAIYSYCGQLFMCLVRGTATATILSSMFIGTNNFFSGLVVRPQQMTKGLWLITYWITPGHFVYEGMVTSVFYNDDRQVIVGSGSEYWDYLNCTEIQVNNECEVDVSQYVDAFYGGHFKRENVARNAIILGAILLVVRASTFVALKKLTYTGK